MASKSKQKRQGHRLYATKLMGDAEQIIKDFDSSKENKLKQIKISLRDRMEILRNLDEAILGALEKDEEIEEEIADAGRFSERILELIVEIESVLSLHGSKSQSGNGSPTQVSKAESAGSANKHAKLPRISLKSFSGEPSQWLTFWDSFRSAVHENTEVHDIDKFNYLKSLLNGSAAATIAGLPLTDANYNAAIELLKNRFGNKQVIISSHMDGLLKLTPLGNTSDVRKLRQTYDEIEAHVRGLQALEVPTESYGSFLVPVLMTKIPEDIRLLVGREMKDGEWNLTEILRLLRSEVENRERCGGVQALARKENLYSPEDRRNAKSPKSGPTSASALFSGNQPSNTTHCTFCKQPHPTASCHVVTNKTARRECLKKQGRCFICLKRSHLARDCPSNMACLKCSGRHHVSLCEMAMKPQQRQPESMVSQNNGNTTNTWPYRQPSQASQTRTFYVGSHDSILLQTAQAFIGNGNTSTGIRARVIFDSGSQKSYITQRARDQLNSPTISKESLLIKTFGSGVTGQPTECEKVKVAVGNVNMWSSREIEAFVVPTICTPIGSQEIDTAKEQFSYLTEIELADGDHGNENLEIDMLIGADFMWLFFTGETRRGENGEGPVASCTTLGWVLSGPVPSEKKGAQLSSVNFVSTHVLKVACEPKKGCHTEELLQRLWDLDSIGIREKETVHEAFLENISFANDRYSVKLPLKENRDLLPDNYDLSLARLNSLVRRLRKEPSIMKEYDQIFQDQLHHGIIERVDETEEQLPGQTHYLPHQAVIRSDALTTKLRVVFDASAKVKPSCPSLNDCTHTGPPLTPGIADILMRFRAHKVGLVADIEKAFLNIAVDEQQRDLMRFLWIDDVTKDDPNVEIYRFCRVIFGMNCSPFLLNATLRHHVTEYYAHDPALAEYTLAGLYVDDLTSGGEDDEEAYSIYKETNSCFAAGRFNLRKWASNRRGVIEKISSDRMKRERLGKQESASDEEQSYAKITVGGLEEIDPTKEHKVLGTNWNLEEDTIVMKLNKIVEFARNLEPTKRNVLRIAAKLFDPLGLISPVMVVLRMLLQELCLSKCEWDSLTPQPGRNRLQKWLTDLEKVGEMTVNRYYFPEEERRIKFATLHGFGDASKGAYCAVVYLCIETEDGYKTSLVAAKSRVTPSSPMSIPRLELLAALILARLISTVQEALAQVLNTKEVFCWTDSITVFYWIQSNKEYKQFVQNRIDEIHKLTDAKSWRHCPGVENPADVGSRGCLASELVDNRLWWEGPAWLKGPPKNYPASEVSKEEDLTEECRTEFKAKEQKPSNVTTMVSLTTEPSNPVKLTEIIDCERFSDATKLFRVTALSLKFIRNLKSAKTERREAQSKQTTLTAEEISEAKVLWIREVQKPFERERNFENLKQQLGLFRHEDTILKCKGRLGNAPLSVETRYPSLLPRRHHVTRLIVEACHRKTNHGGVKETLVEVRTNFWIPKGRQYVKRILHQCVICKKREGVPYRPPPTADLPESRVSGSPAFTHVGVDFAGPVYVKSTSGSTKQMKKAYICLFTCATSRALHLELTPDLSTEAFVRCLRRFIARRGRPASITSDNAKTFKRANKELGQLLQNKRTQDFAANQGITWKFILEKAPWWGGYYERMVQLVKRSLRKVLGKAQLSFEELLTVLTEVEGVLNSRPLTYVYSDITDQEPLTPSHLVIGRRLATLPNPAELSDDEETASSLERRARYLSRLLEHFWKRWSNEYLVGLREFHYCGTRGNQNKEVKVGDVVLIHDDSLARSKWRLGEITELIESKDGHKRGAVLRAISKKGKPSTMRRAVQKLVPLEVNTGNLPQNEHVGAEEAGIVQQPDHPAELVRPPRRAAAATADKIRRLLDQQ